MKHATELRRERLTGRMTWQRRAGRLRPAGPSIVIRLPCAGAIVPSDRVGPLPDVGQSVTSAGDGILEIADLDVHQDTAILSANRIATVSLH